MPPVIRPDCPCPKKSCKRYTLCDECEAPHAPRGGLPYCKRPPRSFWDRGLKLFRVRK